MYKRWPEEVQGARPANGPAGCMSRPAEPKPAGAPNKLICEGLLSVVRQFYDTALSWHCNEAVASNANGGIEVTALHLHAMNFNLWHHEDAVRRPGIGEHEVADRKRSIDDLNARRNAAIEDIDVTLLDRINPNENRCAMLHTETPAMIVDRLSVLTLRILHTKQAAQAISPRLAVLEEQYDDLWFGLEQFLTRMQRGEIRFKLYRQFKSAGQRSHCALFEQQVAVMSGEPIQSAGPLPRGG